MSGILAVLAVVLMLPAEVGAASTYKALYEFKGSPDGANPSAGLIFDAAGNLYGTTTGGGTSNAGTVFKLTPNSNGSWTESVLYSFCSLRNCADGGNPNAVGLTGAGLISDAAGNLYGTTTQGGSGTGCPPDVPYGCGVVFKLTPNADGSWTESVLHKFCSCTDGAAPFAGLIFDGAGNLYGTTFAGASNNSGTVFKLKPHTDGSWTESVLHRFTGADGQFPEAGLIFDAAGNLYGTTTQGGIAGFDGVVFKLKPNSDGSWTYSVVHYFHSAFNPTAGLIDASGTLYGTAPHGGPAGDGAVFKLAPMADGGWAYSVLRFFSGKPAMNPFGGLVLDKAGNLYGTTLNCGTGYNCQGVVFEITP
jgi:uncharacterized repeat protein (TIGR03803 family)